MNTILMKVEFQGLLPMPFSTDTFPCLTHTLPHALPIKILPHMYLTHRHSPMPYPHSSPCLTYKDSSPYVPCPQTLPHALPTDSSPCLTYKDNSPYVPSPQTLPHALPIKTFPHMYLPNALPTLFPRLTDKDSSPTRLLDDAMMLGE